MLIAILVLAVPTAIAIWLTERVDRPRRRAYRLEQLNKARQAG